MKATLLDTGVIVALLDRDEHHQVQCVETVSDLIGPLGTCESAVAEACYLLRGTPGVPDAIIANVANGVFQTPLRLADQAAAVGKLMRKYRDVPIELADQMDTGQILTLDRDFEIYRWRSRQKFELLVKL